MGLSPWGRKELDMTELLHFPIFSFFLLININGDLHTMKRD